MRISYLQHVPFENPAYILEWCQENNISISGTALYNNESFPRLDEFDCLVIMGGPMGVYDEDKYLWLKPEKKFIHRAIESNKIIIGICLGAQLIADVLGASVYKNDFKEIGWFPVSKANGSPLAETDILLPDNFYAFHWHGDTYDIPHGAIHVAESKACKNQAFVFNNRIFAFQFHLESTQESIDLLIENCAHELTPSGKHIQSEQDIRKNNSLISKSNNLMKSILDYINDFSD